MGISVCTNQTTPPLTGSSNEVPRHVSHQNIKVMNFKFKGQAVSQATGGSIVPVLFSFSTVNEKLFKQARKIGLYDPEERNAISMEIGTDLFLEKVDGYDKVKFSLKESTDFAKVSAFVLAHREMGNWRDEEKDYGEGPEFLVLGFPKEELNKIINEHKEAEELIAD